MYKKKTMVAVAVLCTVMLVFTSCQVAARKTVKTETNIQNILAKYCTVESNEDGSNLTLKNSTKQLLRILLFIGVLGIALSSQLKGRSVQLTIQTESMRKPMKINVNIRLVLLMVDAMILVSILKNIEKKG